MYLSLKGSLGHTPITDRVGEGPLQIAEGAAAAYSLRNLGSDSPSVVRVRRESDNNERDFTAQDISTSVLTNWVNQQITPPLDLRELTATGRDGPIIEAAAAYSLRNLSDSYAGDVVEVRRGSDGNTESFTATEVTDGTLVAWVSEAPIAQNSTSNPYTTFTNASNTGFTATLSSATAYAGFGGVIGSSGDSVTVSFDLDVVSGSPSVALRAGLGAIASKSNLETNLGSGSYSLTFNATATFGFIGFSEGDLPSEFTVSNFEITSVSGATYVRDGTVSKWYDQSTTSGVPNAKHAVQTDAAKQPKIVDAGSLVTGGLAFDGVNDRLDAAYPMTSNAGMSLFVLANIADGQSAATIVRQGQQNPQSAWIFQISSDPGDPLAIIRSSTGTVSTSTTEKYITAGGLGDKFGEFALYGANHSNGIGREILVNGESLSLTKPFGSDQSSTHNSTQALTIGDSTTGTSPLQGIFSEVILYYTDQSDNRTALEANIGEVYGIAGIPAYDNTVNGFVETWYDQSGNGNNATQLTAAYQPKIVNAGVYLGEVDFLNGTSTFLETNNSDLANLSELSLFSVLEPVTASINEFPVSAGSIVNSTGNYGGWAIWANGFADRLDFTTQARGSGTNTQAQKGITSTSPVVYSAILNGTDGQASVNGVLGTENTSMITPNNTDTTRRKLRLGCQYTFTPASFYSGAMKEIILYTSDQSANRPAIEANINNQYDIY